MSKNIHDVSKGSLSDSIVGALLEHSFDTFVLVNTDMTIFDMSEQNAEAIGISRDKLKGMKIEDIYPPGIAGRRIEYLKKSIETRTSQKFTDERDGEIHNNYIYPVLDENGSVIMLAVHAKDVTDYRTAESKLQETERNLAEAQEMAQLGSWEWFPETGIMKWSEQTFRLFGWEPGEVDITNDLFISRILPKDRKRVETELRAAVKSLQTYDNRYSIVRTDNEVRIHHAWGEVVQSESDRLLRIVGAVQDITEWEQVAVEKHESEERYRMLVENAFDAIYLMRENHYEYVNPRFCEITGYSSEELTSPDFNYDVLIPESTRTYMRERYAARKRGDIIPNQYQVQIIHKSGRLVDIEVTTVPIDEPGVVYVLGVMRDISQRKQAEAELRKSESRSRAILTALPDQIFQINREGKILSYEGPQDEIYISEQNPVAKNLHDNLPVSIADKLLKSVQKALDTNELQLSSFILTIKGRPCWFESRMTVCGEDVVIAIIRNITEEKRQEQAQIVLYRIANAVNTTRDLQELFQFIKVELGTLIDTTNFFIALYDDETDTISLQYYIDEKDKFVSFPVGRTFTSHVIRTQKPLLVNEKLREELIASGKVEPIGSAAKVWLGVPLKLEEQVKGVVVVQSYTDPNAYHEKDRDLLQFVSEQIAVAIEKKTAEDALRESEHFNREVISSIGEGIIVFDRQLRIKVWNRFMVKLTGVPADEVLGKEISEVPDGFLIKEGINQKLELALSGESVYSMETLFKFTRSGREGWIVALYTPQLTSEGEITGVVVSIRDITERKQAEKELVIQRAYMEELFEGAPEAIAIMDSYNRIIRINREFTRFFGYTVSEADGKSVIDLIVPPELTEEGRRTTDQVVAGETIHFESVRIDKHGNKKDVSIQGRPIILDGKHIAGYGIYRDITESKKLEEQLRQSQKMEAVGRLAGGVAHDFNNLLTVITGHSELLLMSLDSLDPLREDIVQVLGAAERASELTGQLLAFSRRQALMPKVVNLNQIISNMERMLHRIIGEEIDFLTILEPDLWKVRVDPGQMEQVIVNLVVNAKDAMQDRGSLTVETHNVVMDEHKIPTHSELPPGSYVMLMVSDTGCGMDRETIKQVFEPFFTSKEIGKGTGLGLSTVYGIIKQTGGHIWVDSQPDKGATFKIILPLETDDGEVVDVVRKTTLDYVPGGSESILIVEDDDTVRKMAVRILKKQGYNVIDARTGGDALMLCQQMEKPVELLITDVIMPIMRGPQLVARIREVWHDVKVLYISGYTENEMLLDSEEAESSYYLQKPFRPVVLAEMVRMILDR